MSEDDLRRALRSPKASQRFVAAYAVGDRRLFWHKDLIRLAGGDESDFVRQAARRGLIILSFLALNPAEAAPGGSQTPADRLVKPVDFGPPAGAKKPARAAAAQEWAKWWEENDPRAAKVAELRPGDATAGSPEADRLAAALLAASPAEQAKLAGEYRDAKGGDYTKALAGAAARASGDLRRQLRDALADRMARMTEKTLGDYLADPSPEVRRAAVLGAAMADKKALGGRAVGLLLDPDPGVERAAHAALKSLSGADHGPPMNATEGEKLQAVAAWRAWWEQGKGGQ